MTDPWIEVSNLIEALTEADDLHDRLRHREALIEALKPIRNRVHFFQMTHPFRTTPHERKPPPDYRP